MPAIASDIGQLLRVMILDDDRTFRGILADRIRRAGHLAIEARSADDLLGAIAGDGVDVLLVEPHALVGNAAEWLAEARRQVPHLAIVLLTAFAGSVDATELGAMATLAKPIDEAALLAALGRAERRVRLTRDAAERSDPTGLAGVLGHDPAMARVFDVVDAVADSKATVLLLGESGTGKTLLARAIHARSGRRDRPFVEVACGSLPETLMESELFGHVKGAFTGATHDKPGRFAAADGGTIFLDEINSAPALMQVKLLRVLQDRAFEPVGSSTTRNVDVRTIVATNAPLEPLVKAGRFRQDLFYRVNVVPVRLPPLRERVGDVAMLADQFVQRFARAAKRQIVGLTPAAMATLQRHAWPGNVRELENAMERAALLARGATIDVCDLPDSVRVAPPVDYGEDFPAMPLEQALEGPERRIIEAALRRNDWARNATARELGIDRTTLFKKMRKLGITGGERDVA